MRGAAREKRAFTGSCGVNASGIRQFNANRAAHGYRRGNQGCSGVNVLKAKDRCWNGLPGAADAA
jgi:hypothetical protein